MAKMRKGFTWVEIQEIIAKHGGAKDHDILTMHGLTDFFREEMNIGITLRSATIRRSVYTYWLTFVNDEQFIWFKLKYL